MTSICPVHKYKADNAINRVFLVDWIKGHECYLCHCLKLCLQKHTEKRSDIEQGCCIHLYDCTGVPNTCRRRSVFMAHSSVGTQWCQFSFSLCFVLFFFVFLSHTLETWHGTVRESFQLMWTVHYCERLSKVFHNREMWT